MCSFTGLRSQLPTPSQSIRSIIVFVLSMVFAQGLALADTLLPATGTLDLTFTSYSGTFSPITVEVGGNPVSTGLISFTLDTSYGAGNYWDIDFDTGATVTDLHVLITFPLLTSLGLSPIPLNIYETGPLDFIPLIDIDATQSTLNIAAVTAGGGTVQTGLFAGTTFLDDNNNFSNNTAQGNDTNVGHGTGNKINSGSASSNITGTVTPPGGRPQAVSGSGKGATSVPEPSTLSLCVMSLAFVSWKALRYYASRNMNSSEDAAMAM